MNRLGSIRHDVGRMVEAEQMYGESLSLCERLSAPKVQTATALQSLGGVRLTQGRMAEAEKRYRKASDILIQLYGDDTVQAAPVLCELAEVYWGNWSRARSETNGRACDPDLVGRGPSPQLGSAYFLLSTIAKRQRRDRDAEQFMRRAIDVWRVSPGPKHPGYASGLTELAVLLSITDPRSSDRLFREALKVVEALPAEGEVLPGFMLAL